MSKHKITCACGHCWEHASTEPLPSDLREICPVCTANRQETLLPPFQHENNRSPRPGSGDYPAHLPLTAGQMLDGFEILEEINRGGMGVIYKAKQHGLNRLVALKVISPERLGQTDALRRFQREVQAAAMLSHPNIVVVYHTDLEGPLPYLAMEYVQGIDLFRLVKKVGRLPLVDACRYMQQTAHGLQHAFEQGLVHRDIKPANLMVTPSPLDASGRATARMPRIKILDMGLARASAVMEGDEGGSLTQAGQILGTPDFISLEQAQDPRKADIRADLFSLGGTMYFLLTGEVPLPGPTLMQKLTRLLTEDPPSPAVMRPEIPASLDHMVRKLMARNPGDRYQTPADLIDELDELLRGLAGAPMPQPRSSATIPVLPQAKSSPALPTSPPPSSVNLPANSNTPSPTTPAPAPPSTSANLPQSLLAHPGGLQALSLSFTGAILLTGGQDETLRVWDATRMRETKAISGDVGPVEQLALAPSGRWAASCSLRLFQEDRVVQMWDLTTGTERRRLRGHTDSVRSVAISADGKRLAAGGADRTIWLWPLDQPTVQPLCLKGHQGLVSAVLFVPTGESILSGGHDGTLRLWDCKTGVIKGSVNAQVGKVLALAFGGASKRVALAGDGLRIRQRDSSFMPLHGHSGPVHAVAFSADGRLLVSGGADGTIRVWRADDGDELRRFEGHAGKVLTLAVSPDGNIIYSGGSDGTLRRWTLG